LKSSLGLNDVELSTVLEGCCYIFDSAAYHSLAPGALAQHLANANVKSEKAEAFSNVWKQQRDSFVGDLRKQTLGAPLVLDDVNWRLHLEMSTQDLHKNKNMSAVLQFVVSDPSSRSASSGASAQQFISTELSQAQLVELAEKLDVVQKQLDALT